MKEKILQAAVKVAESMPLHAVTREDIAAKAKCAPSLVSYYLGSAQAIRGHIINEAVRTENIEAVAGAIVLMPNDPRLPIALKRKALKFLAQ